MTTSVVEQAIRVMNAHIDALNRRDAKAVARTLHFPHHRLSGTQWKTWETADHYFDDFLNRAGPEWKYTVLTKIDVLSSSIDKVHLDVGIGRHDAEDNLLVGFSSLWVIVEIDGVWAAKMRSSFAPQNCPS